MKKFKNEKARAKASVQGSGSSVRVARVNKAASSKRSKTARKNADDRHRRPIKLNGAKGHLCPTKAKLGTRSMIDARTRPSGERRRLLNILEEHGVSVAGFDALRADAYEKHLAKRSLKELDGFYGSLLNSSEVYEQIQPQCPRWGKGIRHNGKLPSVKTLTEIRERVRTDWLIQEQMREDRAVRELNGAKGHLCPTDHEVAEEEYLNAAVRVLGRELIAAKVNGKPIGENLKMFDRLLRVAGLRVRQQKESREQAEFEWFKQGQPITEPEVSPEANGGTQSMIDGRTRPSGEDGTDNIIERIYGPNPFKTKPVDPNAKPYLQAIDPASDQPKPAWWTPGTVLIAGPSQKYPKGVRRHVVSGNPHCVATMACVDVESEEFRAIYDETGTAKAGVSPGTNETKAEGEKRKAETNKGVQCSVSSVQNPSARATDGNNKDAEGAKAENGKPKWWKPGSILIAGPSAEYPKGVGKDVITGRLYCVATGKAACVENAESKSGKNQPNSEVVKPDMATGKSPEPAGKNACPTSAPQSTPVESLEEYTARKRKEAEQKAWEARQMRIRDKSNGTEKYFYPPGYGPNN